MNTGRLDIKVLSLHFVSEQPALTFCDINDFPISKNYLASIDMALTATPARGKTG